jgi:hypothetical protein
MPNGPWCVPGRGFPVAGWAEGPAPAVAAQERFVRESQTGGKYA